MTFRLYDSATRSLVDFVPRRPGKAGVYVCGLTVQSEPHVGHVRSGVNFDVLRRWLTHCGYDVDFIRNVTDIDDKILTKAAAAGRPWYNLAAAMKRELDHAYAALNVAPPTYEPLATGHIPEMIELIDELIKAGHDYPAGDQSGDVYFAVTSFTGYGDLTGQRPEDLSDAGDADPRGKRDPRDFALWKGVKPEEPRSASWPSPWGRGRPGWHIECSAMARKYLGREFDIHGGGLDLRFPHHENEQAQSRAAGDGFAQYWMHNAWITTAGEKMSKSLGNSLTIPEVLKRYRGNELRFYLLSAHYRSHMEFSFDALDEAAVGYRRIETFLGKASASGEPAALPAEFVTAMNDDLATPAAIAVLYDAVREGNRLLAQDHDAGVVRGQVQAMVEVLGLAPADPAWQRDSAAEASLRGALDALVQGLLTQRNRAREARDFTTADAIRDQLGAAGLTVEDTPSGPVWSVS